MASSRTLLQAFVLPPYASSALSEQAAPPHAPPGQGILGTTPWLALVFSTLYLQLLGFSDLQASVLVAIFLASNAAGKDWEVQEAPCSAPCWLSRFSACPLKGLCGMPHQARIISCRWPAGWHAGRLGGTALEGPRAHHCLPAVRIAGRAPVCPHLQGASCLLLRAGRICF